MKSLGQYISLGLIKFYQVFLSPARGLFRLISPGQCKFTPSCSEYAEQAVKKYGVMKGVGKTSWRLLRCHPWSKGGVDLP